MTATPRTSCERYTFPAGEGHIILNLGQGLTNESGAMVRRVSTTEVEGVKLMGTFCYTTQAVFPLYFVMRISHEPSKGRPWKFQPKMQGIESAWSPDDGTYKLYENYHREIAGDDIGYCFSFDNLEEGEQVTVSMGVSFVSMENARMNLEAEQQGKEQGKQLFHRSYTSRVIFSWDVPENSAVSSSTNPRASRSGSHRTSAG